MNNLFFTSSITQHKEKREQEKAYWKQFRKETQLANAGFGIAVFSENVIYNAHEAQQQAYLKLANIPKISIDKPHTSIPMHAINLLGDSKILLYLHYVWSIALPLGLMYMSYKGFKAANSKNEKYFYAGIGILGIALLGMNIALLIVTSGAFFYAMANAAPIIFMVLTAIAIANDLVKLYQLYKHSSEYKSKELAVLVAYRIFSLALNIATFGLLCFAISPLCNKLLTMQKQSNSLNHIHGHRIVNLFKKHKIAQSLANTANSIGHTLKTGFEWLSVVVFYASLVRLTSLLVLGGYKLKQFSTDKIRNLSKLYDGKYAKLTTFQNHSKQKPEDKKILTKQEHTQKRKTTPYPTIICQT